MPSGVEKHFVAQGTHHYNVTESSTRTVSDLRLTSCIPQHPPSLAAPRPLTDNRRNPRPSHSPAESTRGLQPQPSPDLRAATLAATRRSSSRLVRPARHRAQRRRDQIPLCEVRPTAAQVTLDAGKEQATFTFPKELPAGKATLAIRYTGILNDKLRGFYLSKTEAQLCSDAVRIYRRAPRLSQFRRACLKATFDSRSSSTQAIRRSRTAT